MSILFTFSLVQYSGMENILDEVILLPALTSVQCIPLPRSRKTSVIEQKPSVKTRRKLLFPPSP